MYTGDTNFKILNLEDRRITTGPANSRSYAVNKRWICANGISFPEVHTTELPPPLQVFLFGWIFVVFLLKAEAARDAQVGHAMP